VTSKRMVVFGLALLIACALSQRRTLNEQRTLTSTWLITALPSGFRCWLKSPV